MKVRVNFMKHVNYLIYMTILIWLCQKNEFHIRQYARGLKESQIYDFNYCLMSLFFLCLFILAEFQRFFTSPFHPVFARANTSGEVRRCMFVTDIRRRRLRCLCT